MRRPATSQPPGQGPALLRPDFWSRAKDAWFRGWKFAEYRCPACDYDLRGLSAPDPRQVRRAIDRFTDARNEHPVPFDWTKSVVHPGGLKQRYADLR